MSELTKVVGKWNKKNHRFFFELIPSGKSNKSPLGIIVYCINGTHCSVDHDPKSWQVFRVKIRNITKDAKIQMISEDCSKDETSKKILDYLNKKSIPLMKTFEHTHGGKLFCKFNTKLYSGDELDEILEGLYKLLLMYVV